MAAKITFFPVGNGDMTLLQLADSNETSLLIDCKIRLSADDSDVAKALSLLSGGTKKRQDDLTRDAAKALSLLLGVGARKRQDDLDPGVAKVLSLLGGGTKKRQDDLTPDVAKALRDRLQIDDNDRPYVDAMLLSHPDEDHCLGLKTHFWLGPLSGYLDDDKPQDKKKIIIREIWSSPMVFRRASKKHPLCDDAKAFNKEAKRRIEVNKNNKFSAEEGDRILIMGEDQDGKTDDLTPILKKAGKDFEGVNQVASEYITSFLFASIGNQDDEAEGKLSKNDSSVIIGFKIKNSASGGGVSRFLSGGDAGVEIWERIYDKYRSTKKLKYNLLLAPHHCSWTTLSHDSWFDNGKNAKVSPKAKKALGQAIYDAMIVSSSKPVVDNKDDPPCIRAKQEYGSILGDLDRFKCTGEESKVMPALLEFKTTKSGVFRYRAVTF